MFDSFGFDPATFSDQELLTKASELHAKIVWAGRFGSSDIISNLQSYLQMIELEQMARWQRQATRDALASAHRVIESDPDLAAAGREQAPAIPGKVVPSQKPRKSIQITRVPDTSGTQTDGK